MLTVLNIVGTRPEAIKMAPLIKELEKYPDHFQSLVCVTGQHRQMLDPILDLFQIKPDYDLDIMRPKQDLSQMTADLFIGLDSVIKETKLDLILAQGDTTSVMVAALVAYYNKIRFGHVEAGLRTGERYSPFPEEVNRKIADSLSDLLFAPTETSRKLLLSEGYSDDKILVTGNTVIDALLTVADRKYDWSNGPLSHIPFNKQVILVTAHRRESFGRSLREMCLAIKDLALRFESKNFHFVYPVHMNPKVQEPVKQILSGISNIDLIAPLDYLSFVQMMKRSMLILTDSGGIQEEAPSLGVPVLVMREATERPEGIEAGVVESNPNLRSKMSKKANPYGDGKAVKRIVSKLLEGARNK
jgi:UDP-N-acetylglucosamine 2-epimerase (non-hydrolysing)